MERFRVALVTLLLGACFSAERADHDGDDSDAGDGGKGGRIGRGGTATGGASGALSGAGGTAGSAVTTGCTADVECKSGTVCIDIDGDQDGFCETGEKCRCAVVGVGVGGTGGVGVGGTAGTSLGGTSGSGSGKGGSAGTGGTGPLPMTALGESCNVTADCGGDPFMCLTHDGLLDGSGPPGGLCTLPCVGDDECLEVASLAYCVSFDLDGNSYCIQGCVPGNAGSPKCRERADFACGILETIPTSDPCIDSNGCGGGQVCSNGGCEDIVPACLPTCISDSACGVGQYCDFATGLCMPGTPTGLPLGSICDPLDDTCNGFCRASDDSGAVGTCSAFCSATPEGIGCGFDGSGTPDNACLYATVVSRTSSGDIDLGISDLMLCGALCDCNADCQSPLDLCMNDSGTFPTNFGRAGYCRTLVSGELESDSLSACPAQAFQP